MSNEKGLENISELDPVLSGDEFEHVSECVDSCFKTYLEDFNLSLKESYAVDEQDLCIKSLEHTLCCTFKENPNIDTGIGRYVYKHIGNRMDDILGDLDGLNEKQDRCFKGLAY